MWEISLNGYVVKEPTLLGAITTVVWNHLTGHPSEVSHLGVDYTREIEEIISATQRLLAGTCFSLPEVFRGWRYQHLISQPYDLPPAGEKIIDYGGTVVYGCTEEETMVAILGSEDVRHLAICREGAAYREIIRLMAALPGGDDVNP